MPRKPLTRLGCRPRHHCLDDQRRAVGPCRLLPYQCGPQAPIGPAFTLHEWPRLGSVVRPRAPVRPGVTMHGRERGSVLLGERRVTNPKGPRRHIVPRAAGRASSIPTESPHVLDVEAENRDDRRRKRDALRQIHDRSPAGMVLRFRRTPEEQEQER